MSDTTWSDQTTPLATLAGALADFNRAREWGRFHKPKDLAMAVSVEANELLELFLWTDADATGDRGRISEELSDILITTMNLATKLGIDLMAAAQAKLALNASRYPVERARGSASKYHAYEDPT